MERARARGDGKAKHVFFFPFLVFLALLDNYLKYPEKHHERLWTRQVNCILIMKSSNIFIRWPGINTVTGKLYLIFITKEQNVGIIYIYKKELSKITLLTYRN